MKCSQDKCNGIFRAISSYNVKNNVRKRHRKCDECGYEDYTIEISAKEYNRMRKLIIGLKILIKNYLGQ